MAGLQGLEADFPMAIIGSCGALLLLAQPGSNLAAGIGGAAKEEGFVALYHHVGGVDGREAEAAMVAREGAVYGVGDDGCSLGIGVQGIGKEVGAMVERLVQVDEVCSREMDYLLDGVLYLGMPVACAGLETGVAVEDGSHAAYVDLDTRIGLAQAVDEGEVVGDELVAIIGPVARIGIVEAEVDDGLVGCKGNGIVIGLLLHVGAMATAQEGGSRMAEVADLIPRPQQRGQLRGVRCAGWVAVAVAVGDAIAYTSHSNGVLCDNGDNRKNDEKYQCKS